MVKLVNRAKMTTSTTGTGTITLGSAVDGFQTFAAAGVSNGDTVRYCIEDGTSSFELGSGVYTASGTTLSRTVSESSNSNNAINLSGDAIVFITAIAADLQPTTFTTTVFTATANQTTFSVSYTVGFVEVFLNGSKLSAADFTATNGSSVVLASGAAVGDTVDVVAFATQTVANVYTQTQSDARYLQLTGGTLTGDLSGTTSTFSGDVTIADKIVHSGDTNTALRFPAVDTFTVETDGTERMRIASTGAASFSSTVTATGAATFNAGVIVDNITIDGTEIDLSSGDLTIDVAGDIILDADGGDFIFADGGAYKLSIINSSDDVLFVNQGTDKDLIFKGYDASSLITALTLDMSEAGAATFNSTVTSTGATINGTLDIEEVYEKVTVQTSTTGTITFDTTVQAVELYTANQTANRTINFSNVNANLAVGQSITAAILMTQGSTAYYLNAYQVDGSSVTPKWQGGSAPTAGNASSIDSYSFTIIKTADATFTVLASITQYA